MFERSAYYDITYLDEHVIKQGRLMHAKIGIKCEPLHIESVEDDIFQTNDVYDQMDAHAHDRVVYATSLDCRMFVKLLHIHHVDTPSFVRKNVRFRIEFEPRGIEFVFASNNYVPLHKCGQMMLLQAPHQVNHVIEQLKVFRKTMVDIGVCAYVINEGCFLIHKETFQIVYHRLEHVYRKTHMVSVASTVKDLDVANTDVCDLVMKPQIKRMIWRLRRIEPIINNNTTTISLSLLPPSLPLSTTTILEKWTFGNNGNDTIQIKNVLETMVPLAAGLYGTTYVSDPDNAFVIKTTPMGVNATCEIIRMAEFYQEIANLQMVSQNVDKFVAKPIVAFTDSTKYGDKYEVYDTAFIILHEDSLAKRACYGYIMFENFSNSMPLMDLIGKHDVLDIAIDLVHISLYFIRKTGFFHSDLHLSNILVRPSHFSQVFCFELDNNVYEWQSLSYEYCIIDFGRLETLDYKLACVASRPGTAPTYDPYNVNMSLEQNQLWQMVPLPELCLSIADVKMHLLTHLKTRR